MSASTFRSQNSASHMRWGRAASSQRSKTNSPLTSSINNPPPLPHPPSFVPPPLTHFPSSVLIARPIWLSGGAARTIYLRPYCSRRDKWRPNVVVVQTMTHSARRNRRPSLGSPSKWCRTPRPVLRRRRTFLRVVLVRRRPPGYCCWQRRSSSLSSPSHCRPSAMPSSVYRHGLGGW